MPTAFIVRVARTAAGKRNGALSHYHPAVLGAKVVDALVDCAAFDPEKREVWWIGVNVKSKGRALPLTSCALLPVVRLTPYLPKPPLRLRLSYSLKVALRLRPGVCRRPPGHAEIYRDVAVENDLLLVAEARLLFQLEPRRAARPD